MPPPERLLERLREAGVSEETSMATWMDDAVGAVLGSLEAHGLLSNTIVIYTCDHLARGKYMCYEGCRVPLIIQWPERIRSGQEVNSLCANVDLAATLAELAGGARLRERPSSCRKRQPAFRLYPGHTGRGRVVEDGRFGVQLYRDRRGVVLPLNQRQVRSGLGDWHAVVRVAG